MKFVGCIVILQPTYLLLISKVMNYSNFISNVLKTLFAILLLVVVLFILYSFFLIR